MIKKLASAVLLTMRGLVCLTLALVDWLTAKVNVSERGYLLPGRVFDEYSAAIVAAWHGEHRPPSLLSCTHWDRKTGGPSRGTQGKMPASLIQ